MADALVAAGLRTSKVGAYANDATNMNAAGRDIAPV
jgi:hypothetical protein